MNSLKLKLQKYLNVKGKLNNMEQVLMEYWQMDIEKVNNFNSSNQEVENLTSRRSSDLVNVRSHYYLKQKTFKYY